MPQAPGAIVRAYFDRLLNRRDLAVCDEFLAPDYVDHDAGSAGPAGPAPTKAYVAAMLDAHREFGVTIHDLLADGDKVAVRLEWRGVRADDGSAYHKEGIAILRLDDQGRIAERWSAYG